MLQEESIIDVADNTGAKKLKVIRILRRGRRGRKGAGVGDVVVCSVREADPQSTVKKKTVVRAVIVRTKAAIHRPDGSVLLFDDNAAVILDDKGNPRGTRIFGTVPRELRGSHLKITSMAPEAI